MTPAAERAARAALARLAEPGDAWLGRAVAGLGAAGCSNGSGRPARGSPTGWPTTGSGCRRWRRTPDWPPAPVPGSSSRATTSGPPRSTTWATGCRSPSGWRGDGDLADARAAHRGRGRGSRLHGVRRARRRRARGRARRPRVDRRLRRRLRHRRGGAPRRAGRRRPDRRGARLRGRRALPGRARRAAPRRSGRTARWCPSCPRARGRPGAGSSTATASSPR